MARCLYIFVVAIIATIIGLAVLREMMTRRISHAGKNRATSTSDHTDLNKVAG